MKGSHNVCVFASSLLLAMLLLLPAHLSGQSSSGAIAGRVTDESGAVVPGATVQVTNVETGEFRGFETNESGQYIATQLNPGLYRVAVEKSGFRRTVREGIVLQVGQRAQIDLSLVVGAVTETVEVTGEAPLLESSDASLGQVIENRKVLDLPLNGRNILSLTALTTGVTPGNSFGIGLPDGRAALIQAASANVSINGGLSAHNDIMIDGVPLAVCCQNQISYQPSIDAVQEFRVRTNMYDAEFGRTSGGLVTFASKGGTNEFHGSIYHFLRNRALDANSFFNNRAGEAKAPFVYNQFGTQVGGPLVKNKLFFFANYEGVRNRRGAFASGRTPTTGEREGVFSVPIYDPLTGNAENNFTRSPFLNNEIPKNRFDPVAVNLIPFWPEANTTGPNNFISNASSVDDENQVNVRLDYHIGSSHRLFGRVSIARTDGVLPDHYGNVASVGWAQQTHNTNIVLNDTVILSPTAILNLRAGYSRQSDERQAFSEGTELTDFGWPASFSNARQAPLLPEIVTSGFLQLSRATLFNRPGEVRGGGASLTKMMGKHSLKFGSDLRFYYTNWYNNGRASGRFTFNTGFTRGPDALRGGGGNSFASFLLGYPSGGDLPFVSPFSTSSIYHGAYVQDDIRLTKNLTLNVGLRWDVEAPRDERYDRLSWFNQDVASPIGLQVGIPDLGGGLQFLGVDGENRQQDTDWNNVGPRFGFAFQATRRLVIRGGYGITYLPIQSRYQSNSNDGFASTTTLISSLDGGRTPVAILSNPFPDGFSQVAGSSAGLLTNLGQRLTSMLRDEPVGYSQQWSLNTQHELTSNLLLDVAYSGSKGSLLPMPLEINELPTNFLALEDELLTSRPNPFSEFIETGPLSRPTTTTRQLLLPFPQFGDVRANVTQLGSSTYHAFQAKLNKRFSSGFSVLAAYTFGKIITDTAGFGTGFLDANPGYQDTYNRYLDRAISPEDVSSRFVISYVWELPFGKGRTFLSNASRTVDAIVGGWQINGITTFAAGQPIVVGNSVPTTSGASRPHNIGRSAKKEGRVQDRLDEFYATSVFTAPGPFEFGSAPRTLPDVRADGPQNFDLSIFKHFQITEAARLQFRAEFFNLFNTPQFAAPGSNGRTSNFGTNQLGVIFLQRNNPRDVQLALRLTF